MLTLAINHGKHDLDKPITVSVDVFNHTIVILVMVHQGHRHLGHVHHDVLGEHDLAKPTTVSVDVLGLPAHLLRGWSVPRRLDLENHGQIYAL